MIWHDNHELFVQCFYQSLKKIIMRKNERGEGGGDIFTSERTAKPLIRTSIFSYKL